MPFKFSQHTLNTPEMFARPNCIVCKKKMGGGATYRYCDANVCSPKCADRRMKEINERDPLLAHPDEWTSPPAASSTYSGTSTSQTPGTLRRSESKNHINRTGADKGVCEGDCDYLDCAKTPLQTLSFLAICCILGLGMKLGFQS